ncbi:kinesin-like protein KIN-14S isoform X2 [Magnolia sinica]|uniref:kinesin-like protein KIN-14S isoform X2 n=1 Tax=Magnolia sinica TaxID=86752 RepID=UPI0026590ED6|nr:kinesin-like protein KIN-14S isoform X2 [Magnolia sinica]
MALSLPQIQQEETMPYQDQTPETHSDNSDIVSDLDQTQETHLEESGIISDHCIKATQTYQTQETQSDNSGIVSDHDQTEETLPATGNINANHDQEQNLPILQKIDALSAKIKMLKMEHVVLSEEVKSIVPASFPSTDLSAALQSLGFKYEDLKKKYLEESSERKRLYNEVIELKGNIRVFCRCRPLSPDEFANSSSSVLDFDPSQETELQITCSDSSKKQFKFDHVFGPQDNQEAVFAKTSPIVTSVLDGFNVCIFAYGQTGTGKTFTMEGTPENRGVNYRTLEKLFQISRERETTMRYELLVSMLEVYNEKIRDLLVENSNQPVKKLEIKQAAEGTQEVPGLVEAPVVNTDEVWELLKAGTRNRAVGSTNANQLSSRSHCLLRVTIRGENLVNGQRSRSHLWLVDLAGSERVGKTEVEGERLKESQCINKSLSALGDVISALASKNPHIPYRNSKLTHLLQSSLGGDCKTLMFVQISPSATDLGETLCSLNFASRVRGIEHGPARKQSDPMEFFKYKQMAEKLKQDEKETKKMMDSLQSLQLKFAAREQLCRNLQEKVKELESQLAEERKARLQQENRAAAKDQKAAQNEKKPPLFPSKLRPPLGRLTNVLPPMGPTRISAAPQPAKEDKENMIITTRLPAVSPPAKPPMRARRISLATSARPQTMQPKRRVSIAVVSTNATTATSTKYSSHIINGGNMVGRKSFVRDPRRRSRIFSPLPEPTLLAMTPDSKRSSSIISSASKFFSPPTQQRSWVPKLPTVISPRRSRLAISSPLNLRGLRNTQALNKFCLSVQRKVVSSPAAQQQSSSAISEAYSRLQQGKEVSGTMGPARQILLNHRRRASIQSFV